MEEEREEEEEDEKEDEEEEKEDFQFESEVEGEGEGDERGTEIVEKTLELSSRNQRSEGGWREGRNDLG